MTEPRPSPRVARLLRTATLGGLICLTAFVAFNLRRAGHHEGDDVALYLRQARSLFDGDVGAVVADNRFAVLNSDPGFSPIAYPWGWPLLLSPFVSLWGLDYDRLKVLEIASLAVWLVLLHGIVRRRLGRIVATAIVAAIASAPAYLEHTDQLLTEFPHMAMVAVVLWWHDHIRSRSSLIAAPNRDLVILGLLVVAAFNIRRESLLLVAVIAVMQLVDIWRGADRPGWPARRASLERSWPKLLTPAMSFATGAVVVQLLLPTELFPDNGNDLRFIDDRWREAPRIVSDQLGLGERPLLGGLVVLLALVGAVVGVRRRPLLDTPLLLVALLTMLAVGTHFRRVDRYWLQVTPWIAFFVASALVAAAQVVGARIGSGSRERARTGVPAALAAIPFIALTIAHLAVLPGKVADVREVNRAGVVQDGPAHPLVVDMMRAVKEQTPPDAVVAFYRARTMTLLTDRRSFQTRDAQRILADSDFWVQRRNSSFWQPGDDEAAIRALGFDEVWSNDRYVLWCSDCSDGSGRP